MCQPKKLGGLGFCDLQKFNEALLVKQLWCLLHDTTSLFYRVFKAKFFPNGIVMDAKYKTRGSFAWQSILKAREFIVKGGVWWFGNSKNIKI